jgi:phosphate transport system substrate-binding protein
VQPTRRNLSILNLLIAIMFLWAPLGCGSAPLVDEEDRESQLQGTITISGAWALYPLMVRWSEEFRKQHPGVEFDISAGGAGKGMADAIAGAVDIGMVSREVYPEEEQRGAYWLSVTKDAVFATISAENPLLEQLLQQGITADTLYDIYISGAVTTWGQVANRPEVTDPIHVYTRSDACGAAATWADYLGSKQEDLLGVGVYGDPGLLDAVVKDPLGIGYNNLNYVYDDQTGEPVAGTKVLPLDVNGNQISDIEESYLTKQAAVDAVASGDYPSPPARDLNLVTHGKPAGLTKTFISWILTEGQSIVPEAGYVPLPQATLEAQLAKLD